jgi:hypothetical protein
MKRAPLAIPPTLRIILYLIGALHLGACAVPATDVKVATMPMRSALDLTREPASAGIEPRREGMPHLVAANIPAGAPRPLLSTPDVRLAYLYEWVDAEGNKHFGEWVAIPVSGFDWIMSDGLRKPIDGRGAQATPAAEAP